MITRLLHAAATVLVAALLAACGAVPTDFPADPEGTLDRVRSEAVLRAGAAPNPGWVELGDGGRRPAGREPALIEEFAASLDAEVEWTVGTEEHLVPLLESGDLDLVVGGLTDQNPWTEKAALTRPYTEVTVGGTTEAHVMMVPMGENALQSALERWLDVHGSSS
jgi:polar amino acid transport system substrate-binding protein